jgi:hypothetical protein
MTDPKAALSELRRRFSNDSRSFTTYVWPSHLELIGDVRIITDSIELLDLGRRTGEGRVARARTRMETAPYLVRRALRVAGYPEIDPTGPPWPLEHMLFAYDHVGNAGPQDYHRSNIGVLFDPHEDRRAVLAVVGCNHEWSSLAIGRCTIRVSCARCEYNYTVDSTD